MLDIYLTIEVIKYNLTLMGLSVCIYACELHLEDRPNDTKLIVGDLGVQADNTISSSFFFFFF